MDDLVLGVMVKDKDLTYTVQELVQNNLQQQSVKSRKWHVYLGSRAWYRNKPAD